MRNCIGIFRSALNIRPRRLSRSEVAAEVALHLRLVGAEIRERKEQPAQQAGPERVASARVERNIHRLQFAQSTSNVQGIIEPEAHGELDQQDDEGRDHADEDHRDLPLLRKADRFTAAGDGVDDDEEPDEHDDKIQPPAQHRGENDGGRVDGHPCGEAALQQKQPRAEETGLPVKAPAQELVGGIDAEPPVHGQKHAGHDDERERQSEIILHESDAALEALSRDRKEGNRARLRGHHGQADCAPPRGPAALQVGVEAPNLTRAPRTVRGDAAQGAKEHHPISDVHEKIRANTASRTTTRTNHPNTNRYTPRHVWNPGRPGGSASDRWSGGNGPVIYPRRGGSQTADTLQALLQEVAETTKGWCTRNTPCHAAPRAGPLGGVPRLDRRRRGSARSVRPIHPGNTDHAPVPIRRNLLQ